MTHKKAAKRYSIISPARARNERNVRGPIGEDADD
jgi:hypothetical protein